MGVEEGWGEAFRLLFMLSNAGQTGGEGGRAASPRGLRTVMGVARRRRSFCFLFFLFK